MTVAAVLVAYAACVGMLGSRVLGRSGWTARAPLLAIVTYLAAGWSVIAALGLAGLTLAVHATALGGGLSHLIGACVLRLRATYGTPGGATVAGLGLTLAGAVAARTALTAATHLRSAGRQALRHAEAARLVGRLSRPWGPCWSSIPSRPPTASPGAAYGDPDHRCGAGARSRPAGRGPGARASPPGRPAPLAAGRGQDRPPGAPVPAADAGRRRAGSAAWWSCTPTTRPHEAAIRGCSPPPWSCSPRPAVRRRPWPRAPPTRYSGYTGSWAPAEPLGRARRRLLRATVAALALTPVLLALTPAVLALALGRLPAA